MSSLSSRRVALGTDGYRSHTVSLLLNTVILSLLSPTVSTLPTLPSSNLVAVQRRPNLPDLIRPSFCPPSCGALFSALPSNFSTSGSSQEDEDEGCACECPAEFPAYLHTAGSCIDKLDECPQAIAFEPDELEGVIRNFAVPVISLPAPGGRLFAHGEIRWSDEIIRSLSPESLVAVPSCKISEIFIDSPIHRWTPYEPVNNFQLFNDENNRPAILFNGSSSAAAELEGVIVQMKLACRHRHRPVAVSELVQSCIALRVTGECAVPYVSQRYASHVHAESVALGLIAMALLVLLFVSLVLYHVCWRLKKRRLITEIHQQFIAHFKQAQQAHASAAAAAAADDEQHAGMGGSVLSPPPHHLMHQGRYDELDAAFRPPVQHVQKRRLYFSAEFLDAECMANPPAAAEQFLSDLRRMIDVAKERIRTRRHMPRLPAILEDDERFLRPMTTPKEPTVTAPNADKTPSMCVEVAALAEEDVEDSPRREPAEESPRSGKSVDSGRESIVDSGSGSSGSDDSACGSEKSSGGEEDEEEEEEEEQRVDDQAIVSSRSAPSSIATPTSSLATPTSLSLATPTMDEATPTMTSSASDGDVRSLIANFERRSSCPEAIVCEGINTRKSSIPVMPIRRQPRTRCVTEGAASSMPVQIHAPRTTPSLIPRLGHSSPRPLQRALHAAPPLDEAQFLDDTAASPLLSRFTVPLTTTRRPPPRKSYAVFPADAMLNKSLPRRPKRQKAETTS